MSMVGMESWGRSLLRGMLAVGPWHFGPLRNRGGMGVPYPLMKNTRQHIRVASLSSALWLIGVEVLKKMVPTIAPVMTAWAENMERLAMEKGVALDSLQWGDALRAGVQRPERVRIMNVDDIPLPNPELTFLARETGIITDTTDGLTFGHGIFLKNNLPDAKRRLIHQLVHCSQYERLGEMRQFIREYVQCCLDFGYAQSPYELEAEARTQEILADFHIGTMTCGSEQ